MISQTKIETLLNKLPESSEDWSVKKHSDYMGAGYGEDTYYVDIPTFGLLKIGTSGDSKELITLYNLVQFIAAAPESIHFLLSLIDKQNGVIQELTKQLERSNKEPQKTTEISTAPSKCWGCIYERRDAWDFPCMACKRIGHGPGDYFELPEDESEGEQ